MKRLTGVTVVLAGVAVDWRAVRDERGPGGLLRERGLRGFWPTTIGTVVLAGIAIAFLRKIDWI